jgi:hypothetical protein
MKNCSFVLSPRARESPPCHKLAAPALSSLSYPCCLSHACLPGKMIFIFSAIPTGVSWFAVPFPCSYSIKTSTMHVSETNKPSTSLWQETRAFSKWWRKYINIYQLIYHRIYDQSILQPNTIDYFERLKQYKHFFFIGKWSDPLNTWRVSSTTFFKFSADNSLRLTHILARKSYKVQLTRTCWFLVHIHRYMCTRNHQVLWS